MKLLVMVFWVSSIYSKFNPGCNIQLNQCGKLLQLHDFHVATNFTRAFRNRLAVICGLAWCFKKFGGPLVVNR